MGFLWLITRKTVQPKNEALMLLLHLPLQPNHIFLHVMTADPNFTPALDFPNPVSLTGKPWNMTSHFPEPTTCLVFIFVQFFSFPLSITNTQLLSPPENTEVDMTLMKEKFMCLQILTGHLLTRRRIMLCHSVFKPERIKGGWPRQRGKEIMGHDFKRKVSVMGWGGGALWHNKKERSERGREEGKETRSQRET